MGRDLRQSHHTEVVVPWVREAQTVAFLTGIRGASIFPLLQPTPALSFSPDRSTTLDCSDGSLAARACIAS
jgi:hypothetical protein